MYSVASALVPSAAFIRRWPMQGALTKPRMRFVRMTPPTSSPTFSMAGLQTTYPTRSPASARFFENEPMTTL